MSCEIRRLRCLRSQTSRSSIISVKSGAVRTIDRLWMLASLAATTWAMSASEPGSLMRGDLDAGGKALLVVLVDVPAHVDPALRLVVIGGQRRRLDRVDGDAGARLQDADDAVAGHGALRRETHRQVAVGAADRERHGPSCRLCRPSRPCRVRRRTAAGDAEDHARRVAQTEPALLALGGRRRWRGFPGSRDRRP